MDISNTEGLALVIAGAVLAGLCKDATWPGPVATILGLIVGVVMLVAGLIVIVTD